jgi:hypothetical protein
VAVENRKNIDSGLNNVTSKRIIGRRELSMSFDDHEVLINTNNLLIYTFHVLPSLPPPMLLPMLPLMLPRMFSLMLPLMLPR